MRAKGKGNPLREGADRGPPWYVPCHIFHAISLNISSVPHLFWSLTGDSCPTAQTSIRFVSGDPVARTSQSKRDLEPALERLRIKVEGGRECAWRFHTHRLHTHGIIP